MIREGIQTCLYAFSPLSSGELHTRADNFHLGHYKKHNPNSPQYILNRMTDEAIAKENSRKGTDLALAGLFLIAAAVGACIDAVRQSPGPITSGSIILVYYFVNLIRVAYAQSKVSEALELFIEDERRAAKAKLEN